MTITCEQALLDFFNAHIERLRGVDNYWKNPIPDVCNFHLAKHNSYAANVEFKEFIAEKIGGTEKFNKLSESERLDWVEIIVKKWGGIRIPAACAKNEINNDISKVLFNGIASRSKLLSFVSPNEYAIYDSRVSASLNAIQFLAGAEGSNGIMFNYADGENKVIGNNKTKKGFRHTKPFTEKCFVTRYGQTEEILEEKSIPIYKIYIGLLKELQGRLSDCKLYDLEMALFYFAEQLCGAAAEKASDNASGNVEELTKIIIDAKTKMEKAEHTRLDSGWLRNCAGLENSFFGN